jgi:hypothetical protein
MAKEFLLNKRNEAARTKASRIEITERASQLAKARSSLVIPVNP